MRVSAKSNDGAAITFTSKAISTDKTRINLQHYEVKDGFITACDGHRLHRSAVEFIPNGVYKIDKVKAEYILDAVNGDDFIMPDFKQVIPNINTAIKSLPSMTGAADLDLSVSFARLVLHKRLVNVDYLKDVISAGEFTCYLQESTFSPLYFQNGTKSAVIMPLSTNGLCFSWDDNDFTALHTEAA
jgi:hypothetical protein